jgi:FHS family L-fucose permease-like MFS transporter
MPDVSVPRKDTGSKSRVIPGEIIGSFILVTFLFSLWGFANDITNPMVAAFKNILLISNFESALVQFAFYGGYCVMAFPAALFIKRFSYKSGILLGLMLYAAGCLMFIPSGWMMAFWAFLLSYFVMTCGLSFLETSANPYILAMGPEETATQRLNFAQSFNPMGSLVGMLIARNFILAKLDTTDEAGRRLLRETSPDQFVAMSQHDLNVIVGPYMILGLVVLAALVVFAVARLPRSTGEDDTSLHLKETLSRLFANKKYIEGVVAQAFYVGVQIMCWTFIIHTPRTRWAWPKQPPNVQYDRDDYFCQQPLHLHFLLKYSVRRTADDSCSRRTPVDYWNNFYSEQRRNRSSIPELYRPVPPGRRHCCPTGRVHKRIFLWNYKR